MLKISKTLQGTCEVSELLGPSNTLKYSKDRFILATRYMTTVQAPSIHSSLILQRNCAQFQYRSLLSIATSSSRDESKRHLEIESLICSKPPRCYLRNSLSVNNTIRVLIRRLHRSCENVLIVFATFADRRARSEEEDIKMKFNFLLKIRTKRLISRHFVAQTLAGGPRCVRRGARRSLRENCCVNAARRRAI